MDKLHYKQSQRNIIAFKNISSTKFAVRYKLNVWKKIAKQVMNKKSRKNPHLRRIRAWDFRKMDEKQFQLKMCSWAIVKIHQSVASENRDANKSQA